MPNFISRLKPKNILPHFFIAVAIIFAMPAVSMALTPIARTDVVPYQRIKYGTTFNFGVVAFSKAGIQKVDFTISGQGYSGGVKSTSEMRLNTRLSHSESAVPKASWKGVWEYYVTISSNEFSSNGTITVTPKVYGVDGGVRTLDAVRLIVEGAGSVSHKEAWVNPRSNDGSGTVGNRNDPFPSIAAAVAAAQSANGGSSNGNIIYLEEYSGYSLDGTKPNTTGEWLTIKGASGADRDNVVIDDAGPIGSTDYLKFEGVTLYSGGLNDYVVNESAKNLWINNCKLTSVGRYSSGAGNGNIRPIREININYYSTNTYVVNVDRAYGNANLVRNTTVSKISEDVFQNTLCVINARVDDVDPGTTLTSYPHADGWQSYGAAENRIVYNYFGTNFHYQGLFIRNELGGPGSNMAFVNAFVEMREPGRQGSATGNAILSSGSVYLDYDWDHVVMWHCSFPLAPFSMYVGGQNNITNSSIIGNIFWELRTGSAVGLGVEPSTFSYGNSQNNEVLYNHYKGSYNEVSGCGGNPQPEGCPFWYSKSPDTSAGRTTFSHGGKYWPEVLNLSDQDQYSNFGYPLSGSPLIDGLPSYLIGIPADVFGNSRDSRPDIGAIESSEGNAAEPEPEPTPNPDDDSNTEEVVGISVVSVSDSSNDGNLPANILDNDLSTRWSAFGDGEYIELDLGQEYELSHVQIAFYLGDQRIATFEILASTNRTTWHTIYNGNSVSSATQEQYNVSGKARYVRIVGYGNTNNEWNSITEVDVFGSITSLHSPQNARKIN